MASGRRSPVFDVNFYIQRAAPNPATARNLSRKAAKQTQKGAQADPKIMKNCSERHLGTCGTFAIASSILFCCLYVTLLHLVALVLMILFASPDIIFSIFCRLQDKRRLIWHLEDIHWKTNNIVFYCFVGDIRGMEPIDVQFIDVPSTCSSDFLVWGLEDRKRRVFWKSTGFYNTGGCQVLDLAHPITPSALSGLGRSGGAALYAAVERLRDWAVRKGCASRCPVAPSAPPSSFGAPSPIGFFRLGESELGDIWDSKLSGRLSGK